MAKNVPDGSGDEEERPRKSGMQADVRIYEPMFVWIFLLSVAVVLNIILADTPFIAQGTFTYTILWRMRRTTPTTLETCFPTPYS